MGEARSITVAPVLLGPLWKKDGTNFYRIRVTLGRQSKYIRTNIMVRRDQLYRGKLRDAGVRYKVEEIMRRAEEAVRSIDTRALSGMDAGQVADYIQHYGDGTFELDFIAFGNGVADAKAGRSSGRTCRYAVKAFAAFVGKDSFDISGVTSSLMRQWQAWLERKYGAGARAVSAYTAAIAYIHGQARLRYNDEETGMTPVKNPFQFYKPPRQRKAPHRAADEGLIQKMIDMRKGLEGRERIGVDTFLLSFALMGMNAPDLYGCAAPRGGVIRYNRTKTRDRREDRAEMAVKIPSQVADIAAEYAGA